MIIVLFYITYIMMLTYILVYIIALLALIWLDYLWLGVIMKKYFTKWLWHLMRKKIAYWPAFLFYLLYTGAICIFAITPWRDTQSLWTAGLYGALLGFTAYMTYDLTNWATLAWRPKKMIIPDILWWTVVTALVAMIWYSVGV